MKTLIVQRKLYNTTCIYNAVDYAFLLDINKDKHLYSAKSYLYCSDIN